MICPFCLGTGSIFISVRPWRIDPCLDCEGTGVWDFPHRCKFFIDANSLEKEVSKDQNLLKFINCIEK